MFNFLKPSVSDFNSITREVQKINSFEPELQKLSDTQIQERVQKLIKQYSLEKDNNNHLQSLTIVNFSYLIIDYTSSL